jgi:predicted nucleic acid-binding Zn finger protein
MGTGEEEKKALREASEEARMLGRVSEERTTQLRSVFGDRFERALRLVEEKRVKKYLFEPSGRIIWIVVGKEKEYQILPRAGYCPCDDFYFRVINGETGLCYHLIAQCLAEALGIFEEVREGDEFYEPLMAEWRSQALER